MSNEKLLKLIFVTVLVLNLLGIFVYRQLREHQLQSIEQSIEQSER